MAKVLTGLTGNVVSWANNTALVGTGRAPISFRLNQTADELETTALNRGNATAVPGLTGISGQMVIRLDAVVKGLSGSVTYASGYTVGVREWSLVASAPALDVTDFSTDGPRSSGPGLMSWSGAYTAHLDDTTAIVAAGIDPASATFTISSGNTLVGSIFPRSVDVDVNQAGPLVVPYAFRGTDNLTAVGSANFFAAGVVAPRTTGYATDTLILRGSTNRTYTFSAFWTNIAVSCAVDQVVTATVDFQGTGALTIG